MRETYQLTPRIQRFESASRGWSLRKAGLTALAVVFLFLGILGLIIPIIPGIIFLVLAILLASKVSRRIRVWSDGQPLLAKLKRRTERLESVDWSTRTKVAALMMLQGTIEFFGTLFGKTARVLRRRGHH